jgi:hypothetical protein
VADEGRAGPAPTPKTGRAAPNERPSPWCWDPHLVTGQMSIASSWPSWHAKEYRYRHIHEVGTNEVVAGPNVAIRGWATRLQAPVVVVGGSEVL